MDEIVFEYHFETGDHTAIRRKSGAWEIYHREEGGRLIVCNNAAFQKLIELAEKLYDSEQAIADIATVFSEEDDISMDIRCPYYLFKEQPSWCKGVMMDALDCEEALTNEYMAECWVRFITERGRKGEKENVTG